MKKSAATLEHIHDEPGQKYEVHKTSMPKLSYSQAMKSYFVASDGAIHQVETCPAHFIEELINDAMQTAKNPQSCVSSLAGLDYRESISRWFALLELLRQRAIVPLFKCRQEAEKALSKQRQAEQIAV
jgi:hypothetical protein